MAPSTRSRSAQAVAPKASTSWLLSLPPELIEAILSKTPQGGIAALARSCRGLRGIATEALFVHPVLGGYANGRTFREACDKDPSRLQKIKTLHCSAFDKYKLYFRHAAQTHGIPPLSNITEMHLSNNDVAEQGCFYHEHAVAGVEKHKGCVEDHRGPRRLSRCGCACDVCAEPANAWMVHFQTDTRQALYPGLKKLTIIDPDPYEFITGLTTLSEIVETLELLSVEIYEPWKYQLKKAFPNIRNLRIEIVGLAQLALRRPNDDILELWNDPSMGPQVYKSLAELEHLDNLTLHGNLDDYQVHDFDRLMQKCRILDLDIQAPLGGPYAQPFRYTPPGLPSCERLERLSIVFSNEDSDTEHLWNLVSEGRCPSLKHITMRAKGPDMDEARWEVKDTSRMLQFFGFTVEVFEDRTVATRVSSELPFPLMS